MNIVDKFNSYRWIVGLEIDAEYPIGCQIKISSAGACTIAGADDFCIGTLYSQPTSGFPGRAGICVDGKYNHRGDGIASEAITAGDRLKVGTPDGTTQRYAKFVVGTDDPGLVRGVALTTTASAGDTFEGLFC
jgi:hypothetical protein